MNAPTSSNEASQLPFTEGQFALIAAAVAAHTGQPVDEGRGRRASVAAALAAIDDPDVLGRIADDLRQRGLDLLAVAGYDEPYDLPTMSAHSGAPPSESIGDFLDDDLPQKGPSMRVREAIAQHMERDAPSVAVVVPDARNEPREVLQWLDAFRVETFELKSGLGGRSAAMPKPDLVLLDLRLPEFSGEGLVRTLRKLERQATGSPFVVIVRRYDPIDERNLVAAGAWGVVSATADLRQQVQNAVSRVLGGHHAISPALETELHEAFVRAQNTGN